MAPRAKGPSKEYAELVMSKVVEGEKRRQFARMEEEQRARPKSTTVTSGETEEIKKARAQRMREKRKIDESRENAKRVSEFYERRRAEEKLSSRKKQPKEEATGTLATPPSALPGPHNGFKRTPLIDSLPADQDAGGWSHMTGRIELVAARLGIEHKMTKGMRRRAEARHKALYRNAIDRARHNTDLDRLLGHAYTRGGGKHKPSQGNVENAANTGSAHAAAIEREKQVEQADEYSNLRNNWIKNKSKWTCRNCSMLNELHSTLCEMCNDSRPRIWSIRAEKAKRSTKREKRSDGFGRRRYMNVPSNTFRDTEGVATFLENAAGRGFKVRKRGEQSNSTCKCQSCGGTIHVKSNWYKEEKVRSQCAECIEALSNTKDVEDFEASLNEWQGWAEEKKSRYERVVEANIYATKHPIDGGKKHCCWRCGIRRPGTESGAWLTHIPDPNSNSSADAEAVGRRYRFCLKCSNAIDRLGKYKAEKSANSNHRSALDQGPTLPQISPIKTRRVF
jgi:hypothetical protein